MTDKIKLKADKFVNNKKLKLNYIKSKDLKILLAEFCEEQIAELKAECDLAIEGRDIKIMELESTVGTLRTFSNEQATCIERLEKENEIFKKANEIIAQQRDNRDADIAELEKENTELKAFRQDCVKLTEDNVVMARQRAEVARQLTKAKKIIKELYSHVFQGMGFMELNDYNVQKAEVEQFISEVEK